MNIYASLLKLYPREHLSVFALEMMQVFEEAEAEMKSRSRNPADRIAFYAREFAGLLGGAARERICFREELRKDFVGEDTMKQNNDCRRFPVSSIALMTFILVILVAVIAKGEGLSAYLFTLQAGRSWDLGKSPFHWPLSWRLISGIVAGFMIAWFIGITTWFVAYAMRRTGAQKLGEFQAWPLR